MSARVEFYRHDLGSEEAESWRRVLDTLFLTLGPEVAAFESELGRYLARDRAGSPPEVVGTSCCSLGMLIALRALDVGPGDEVITTPMTFAATTNAILQAGAWPVLADVEPETGLIDPSAVERAVGPRTRAILPVHLYGQLADMPALRAIADAHGLVIVEDSAHGIEIERNGVRPSELSEAAIFSFYATKTLTSGDGGAVAVRDPALAARLRRLRSHGMSRAAAERHGSAYAHWDLLELGYKANMTDLDAALLRPQLPRAEARRARREELARRYEELLMTGAPALAERSPAGVPGLVARRGRSSHHLFTFNAPLGRREELLAALGAAGIGTGVHYRALHTLSYMRELLGLPEGSLPVATEIGERTLSLPLYPSLTEGEQDRVLDAVAAALRPRQPV